MSKFQKKTSSRTNRSENRGPRSPFKKRISKGPKNQAKKEGMRLNQFIAHAGICSRREADQFIAAGVVSVNDEVVVEMGYRLKPTDSVKFNNAVIKSEKKKYLLLNKPKGFICTSEDPKNRKTVMELVSGACKERLYPVGRLHRQTTGLLLFTNDGEMAKKLTNPKHGIKKIYHVLLDKNLKSLDLKKIVEGIKLEEGIAYVEAATYIKDAPKERWVSKFTRVKTVRFVKYLNSLAIKCLDLIEFTLLDLQKKIFQEGDIVSFPNKKCQC